MHVTIFACPSADKNFHRMIFSKFVFKNGNRYEGLVAFVGSRILHTPLSSFSGLIFLNYCTRISTLHLIYNSEPTSILASGCSSHARVVAVGDLILFNVSVVVAQKVSCLPHSKNNNKIQVRIVVPHDYS